MELLQSIANSPELMACILGLFAFSLYYRFSSHSAPQVNPELTELRKTLVQQITALGPIKTPIS